jgi:hypothetical protein
MQNAEQLQNQWCHESSFMSVMNVANYSNSSGLLQPEAEQVRFILMSSFS